jgi:uncharacterized repeat protein (TIGR01451 family)
VTNLQAFLFIFDGTNHYAMKKIYTFAVLLFAGFALQAQIINIPDAALKAKFTSTLCASHLSTSPEVFNHYVDSNGDGEIQQTEADAVYGLSVSTSTATTTGNIASLEGLQYFPNLKVLICSGNSIAIADFTAFPAIEKLELYHDGIGSLNVSGLASLKTLWCGYNQLTSLNLSGLSQLTSLACFNNQLTTLNLNGLSGLAHIECNNNQIATITSGTLPLLNALHFPNNQMTSIDLGLFPMLTSLDCSQNPLASIALNGMAHLSDVTASFTLLTQIDCSQTSINRLICTDNPNLAYINVQNGFVSWGDPDMLDYPFRFYNSPALTTVCIDPGEEVWLGSASVDPALVNVYMGPNCSGDPIGAYNQVTGIYTLDQNGDGCGTGDPAVSGVPTKMTVTGNVSTTFSNQSGQYSFFTPQQNVTITPHIQNSALFNVTPASYTFNFTSGGNNAVADFCVTPIGVHPDLKIAVNGAGARPGFDAVYHITYTNKGNQVLSGDVNFTFDDSVLDFVSANPSATQAGGTLSWSFSGLMPFETHEVTVILNLNSPIETPPLNAGDQLTFEASISGDMTDENPADNTRTFVQTLVNSFDPNDKAVSEGEEIGVSDLEKPLHYMIRFQNNGSADAVNISVNDILSENLDASTVQILATSHPSRTMITNENRLDVYFDDINLPPATVNNDASQGYILFEVRPKANLVIDDVIENTASIYFDFNFPIITNTVTTTVVALGTNEFALDNFAMYPNPAGHSVTIAMKNEVLVKRISVYNTLGQLVMDIPARFSGASLTTDISGLTAGTYIVEIIGEHGKTSKKLLKF